jgi:hypothetical protein
MQLIQNRQIIQMSLAAVFLLISGIMLFEKLGNYALWDDETMVTLAARGIIETGDTTAVHGKNVVAFREGFVLRGLADRSTPPLSSYVAAASLGLLGPSPFAARIPFALMGFCLMVLAVFVLLRAKLSTPALTVCFIAILGNTSLMLFLRQCRYYAPAILISTILVLLYIQWKKDRVQLAVISILFVLLFAANYMSCAVLMICMAADYLLVKRKSVSLRLIEICMCGLIVIPPCLLISMVWNPFGTKFGNYAQANDLMDRLVLFLWNLRDMNRAEYFVGGLLLASIPIALIKKDPWIIRGVFFILLYTLAISFVSPQIVKQASVADIRYLAPLITVGIAVGVRTLLLLFANHQGLAVALAIPVFLTNTLNGGGFTNQGVRSVPLEFCGELLSPPEEPYTPVVQWINQNVPKDSSIWVLPDYMTYPLMFHAPDAVYAWQLRPDQKKEEQFKSLPDIHFQGLVTPDYIIVFGPSVIQIRALIQKWKAMGVQYDEIYGINTFWKDLYRPELFWRTFKPITGFDPETQAIYIFKHLSSSGDLQKKHP